MRLRDRVQSHSNRENSASSQPGRTGHKKLKGFQKHRRSAGRQLGSIAIAGDLRIQYESFYHQLNPTANAANPSILGNQLSARNRLRMRARLSLRGQANSQFDWGVRLPPDCWTIQSHQSVLTDFYNRKQFALDQAISVGIRGQSQVCGSSAVNSKRPGFTPK